VASRWQVGKSVASQCLALSRVTFLRVCRLAGLARLPLAALSGCVHDSSRQPPTPTLAGHPWPRPLPQSSQHSHQFRIFLPWLQGKTWWMHISQCTLALGSQQPSAQVHPGG
jgi:hypothetical protein